MYHTLASRSSFDIANQTKQRIRPMMKNKKLLSLFHKKV
jgi:hypothetical protein